MDDFAKNQQKTRKTHWGYYNLEVIEINDIFFADNTDDQRIKKISSETGRHGKESKGNLIKAKFGK